MLSIDFAPPVAYPLGQSPWGAAAADLNGDGKTDLAVANIDSDTLSVLLNNGGGSFASKVDYRTSSGPRSVVAADFDGDGTIDLATANYKSRSVNIFLNNGKGTFGSAVNYATGNYPYSVTAGDFNGDGKIDLAVANFTSATISMLLNNGDGTFAGKVDYATGSFPSAVTAADFNGDGKVDLASANASDNTVSLLLNNGDGTFASKTDCATGKTPFSIVAADFNADARMDLAVANNMGNSISVLLNDGNGAFAPRVDYATGNIPTAIAAGDFNDDGRVDLVVTNNDDNTIGVWQNRGGAPLYADRVDFAAGKWPTFLAVADFNGDGKTDLIAIDGSPCSASVLLNASVRAALSWNTFTVQSSNVLPGDKVAVSRNYQIADAVADSAFQIRYCLSSDKAWGDGDDIPISDSELISSSAGEAIGSHSGILSVTVPAATPAGKYYLLGKVDSADAIHESNENDNVIVGSTINVLPAGTVRPTVKVTASATSLFYGKAVTLTATLSGSSTVPTGVCSFWDGTKILGAATVNAKGQAVLNVSSLAIGTHSITASYSGDTRYPDSTSSALAIKVLLIATSVAFTMPTVPSTLGTSITFNATVANKSGTGTIPAGKVVLYDRSSAVQMATLSGGKAVLKYSGLGVGRHAVMVVYLPAGGFAASSSAVQVVSVGPAITVTYLASSLPSAYQGENVVLTAKVVSRVGVPTGTMTFRDGNAILGVATLVNGSATCGASTLSAGSHAITAVYSGSGTSATSKSYAAGVSVIATSQVDLLVVYTQQASDSEGGASGISGTIAQAVADANTAFWNSQIAVTLRLAAAKLVDYTESGSLQTDLNALETPGDGMLDDVQNLRKQYRADLVSLFESDGDYGGLGDLLNDVTAPDDFNIAYSVVLAGQATAPTYTLAHELGHNFGCAHEQAIADGPGAFPYSYGYRFTVNGRGYHDIMAYGQDSDTTIPYFSNPRLKYLGVPIGSAMADNAQTANRTAPMVSQYSNMLMSAYAAAARPAASGISGDSGVLWKDGSVTDAAGVGFALARYSGRGEGEGSAPEDSVLQ